MVVFIVSLQQVVNYNLQRHSLYSSFNLSLWSQRFAVTIESFSIAVSVCVYFQTQVSVSNTWRKEVGQTATVGPTGTNTWPCKEPLNT